MKFSERWLREWINPSIDTQGLAHQITMAGLEVDSVEPAAGAFTGVVVAEIISAEPHPEADKLRVCQVSDGKETRQIVCGAPNARAGIRVPLATVGAVLPGGMNIGRAKLRGVESLGMLCSAAELQISEDSSGLLELSLDAPLGQDIRDCLGLDDHIIDVDLTPNRSDCLSIRGLAREVGVLFRRPVNTVSCEPVPATHAAIFGVEIRASEACPRYVGRVIRNVNVAAETPLWMRERLRRSGIRSIDPVVDVTNYVMIELGQPMHAFDLNTLKGGIVVRLAEPGEHLVLLDGTDIALTPNSLVIADHERALALAGVMGGEGSGVSEATRDIFLESAFFSPLAVVGRARAYGLHTDSSHRFERGVDSRLQSDAVERATRLLLDICGGEPGPLNEVVFEDCLPELPLVHLREEKVERILGLKISKTESEEILTRLGLLVEKLTADGWKFRVPSHRFDISIDVDLIEEIGRVHGYNNLPVTKPFVELGLTAQPEGQTSVARLRDLLVDRGYQEAITYSFVDPEVQRLLAPDADTLMLANPIASDLSVMRTTLWAGLLKALGYNQNRQQARVRLFETGLRFVMREGQLHQEPMLAGLISGSRYPEGWADSRENVDFYDLKGDVEAVLAKLGVEVEFTPGACSALHPGRTARLVRDGVTVGWLGQLHPAVQKRLDLHGAVYLFELSLSELSIGYVPYFKEFSKYPEVRRDLAILVSEGLSFSEVETAVRTSAGQWLTEVRLFDVYQGDSVEAGQRSLAMSLSWQCPERTLNDEEIAASMAAVVKRLSERFAAKLRS